NPSNGRLCASRQDQGASYHAYTVHALNEKRRTASVARIDMPMGVVRKGCQDGHLVSTLDEMLSELGVVRCNSYEFRRIVQTHEQDAHGISLPRAVQQRKRACFPNVPVSSPLRLGKLTAPRQTGDLCPASATTAAADARTSRGI